MSAVRLELEPISVRLAAPLRTAHGTISERAGLIVRAIDAEGLVGLGEVAPLPQFGTEDLAAARAALDQLRSNPIVSADDPSLDHAPAARAALDQALLDLEAQRRGLPLAALLDPEAADQVVASALLSAETPAQIAAEAADAVERGARALKIKVAAQPLADDLDRVAAVRGAVERAAAIRLDANGGWTATQAREALAALSRFDIEICEQPIAPGRPEEWPALAALGVPLAADESVGVAGELESLLRLRCLAAVVLKLPVVGGHRRAIALARRARAAGAEPIATSALEGRVGRAGALHLAAALRSRFAQGVADGPPRPRIWLPTAPGLGLRDSRAAIEGPDRVPCLVAQRAAERPRSIALADRRESLDYAELERRTRRVAAALRARGVRDGDRVAILAPTSIDAAVAIFAAARAGACAALLNARLGANELAPLAARADAKLVLADAALLGLLPGAIDLRALSAADRTSDQIGIYLRAPRTLIFTSGTTGAPKAALLSHAAHLASARAAASLLALDDATRWLCNLPLFHVGGLSILDRCALVGGTALLRDRFDATEAARDLIDGGVTHASLVATTLLRLLDAHGDRVAPSTLRAILVGGGPVPRALLDRARRLRFPVLQTYGLTETGSLATCERPDAADGSSAGPAVPGTDVRVVDGEIQLRGPTLFEGYLGDRAATATALAGGWLHTGDLGAIDKQSRLFVFARRTDLIVSGGENVSPAEVEAALAEHPAVAEAAVVGREDPIWGQAVIAAVVLARACEPAELHAFARAKLAAFKRPRAFVIVEALPRLANGKLDRRALRDQLASDPSAGAQGDE